MREKEIERRESKCKGKEKQLKSGQGGAWGIKTLNSLSSGPESFLYQFNGLKEQMSTTVKVALFK